MFSQLPDSLKKEVLQYISTDFSKAKAIYDAWLEQDAYKVEANLAHNA
jgi:hypothetical protein